MAGSSFRSWPRAARIAVYVTALAVLLTLAGAATVLVTVRRSFPQTSGTLEVAGLGNSVRVVRDDLGIPRIYADDPHDLFFAQGYVQAQDRFWQMDVARHRASGRLAELVGPDALPGDKVMRTLGWREAAERELDLLDQETLANLEDYSRGVTEYLRTHAQGELSLEYAILDTRGLDYSPEPWTPVDSLTWLKALSWGFDSSAEAEQTRAILAARLDPAQITELESVFTPVQSAWVVSAAHSETGSPLVANAPQLPAGLPGAWYQVGLHCNDVSATCPYDVVGFTSPGLPGVLAGHNADIAWGITPTGADVSDAFLEKINGHTYLRDGQQVPLEEHRETIEVLGEEPFRYTVRRTAHGPLLSDVDAEWARAGANAVVPDGSPPRGTGYGVAISTTIAIPNRTMDAVFAITRATGWDDFRSAVGILSSPALTYVYADRVGHIAAQDAGLRPNRPVANSGRTPVPGWISSNDWTGFVPLDLMESEVDPGTDIVVAGANASRVSELLAARDKVSVADVNKIQNDTWNRLAPVLTPLLVDLDLRGFNAIGQALLRHWDFTQPTDSGAAAYFNAVYSHLLQATFGDELPGSLGPDDDGAWADLVAGLLASPSSHWWDDVTTKTVIETRDDVLRQAMLDARDETIRLQDRDPAKWRWGNEHRLDLGNRAMSLADSWLARRLLDRGGRQLPGSGVSIDSSAWSPQSTYAVTRAQSMRMVISLGSFDDSTWVNLTGASGHAYSDHYTDQLSLYAEGKTATVGFREQEGRTLRLVPARTE